MRTWLPVEIPKFYNPVTTLLLPKDEKDTWTGMRTVGQLKKDKNIKTIVNQDSLYKVNTKWPSWLVVNRFHVLYGAFKWQFHEIFSPFFQPIERKTRHFNALRIPRTLQRSLPFKDKPKSQGKKKQQRGGGGKNYRAVILEPEQKKV